MPGRREARQSGVTRQRSAAGEELGPAAAIHGRAGLYPQEWAALALGGVEQSAPAGLSSVYLWCPGGSTSVARKAPGPSLLMASTRRPAVKQQQKQQQQQQQQQ